MRYILLILGCLLCGWLFYNDTIVSQQTREVTISTNDAVADLKNLQALDKKVSDTGRLLYTYIDSGESKDRFDKLNNDPIQLGSIVPRDENPFLPLNTNYLNSSSARNSFNIINETNSTSTPNN